METVPDVSLPTVAFMPMLPTGELLTLVFYIALGFYAIFTGILYYHWNAYATDKSIALATFAVYFAITLPLIITMATTALFL